MYWLTAILGLSSLAAPFVLGYNTDITALWTSLTIGLVLVVASGLEWAARGREAWEYWVAGIAGIAAILAPFVLGFAGVTMAVWTLVIVGLATVLAAGIRLFPRQQY